MKRLMFDGCAGWLHEAAGKAGTTGVVLCAPHMHEAMWTHRAMRHLADDLAAAGVSVLRFDYYGTGDSAGDGGEPDFVLRAVQSVMTAAAQLRALTGVENVVLCGLRLGAALAVLASEAMVAAGSGQAPAALVLMAPVVNGRAYLRELRALGAFYEPEDGTGPSHASQPSAAEGDGLEILSYRLSAQAMQQIGELRLDRRPGIPAPRVLLLDDAPGSTSTVASLARHYQQAGTHVDLVEFVDSRLMMKSPEVSAVPEASWRRIVEWLAPDDDVTRAMPRSATAADAAFEVDGVIEHSLWIDNGRQFGVLCVPMGERPPAIVIFPNTGGSHHVGDGRAFVLLSRTLARRGFAALRLDVSMLGDSPGAAREMAVPRAYAPHPRADVSAVVDWIRSRGYTRIVMAGVCSGAYLSLQAALANEHVTGVVMANALKYLWRDQDETARHAPPQRLRDYLYAARNLRNWQRLLRGEFPLRAIVAGVARVAHGAARKLAGGGRGQQPSAWDDIEREYARGAMAKLSRRRVQLDLLYGADDAGLALASRCFGDDFSHLRELPGISAHRCAHLDHAMILRPSCDTFLMFLVQNLRRQLLPADGASAQSATEAQPAAVATPARAAR